MESTSLEDGSTLGAGNMAMDASKQRLRNPLGSNTPSKTDFDFLDTYQRYAYLSFNLNYKRITAPFHTSCLPKVFILCIFR